MAQMRHKYRLIARDPLPPDLQERVAVLHAFAILRSRNKCMLLDVGERDDHNSGGNRKSHDAGEIDGRSSWGRDTAV
jgi:hypothetical protein